MVSKPCIIGGDVEISQHLSAILTTNFQFVIGILMVYILTVTPKYFSSWIILQFTSLILFAYQIHAVILVLHLMIATWKILGTKMFFIFEQKEETTFDFSQNSIVVV